MCQSCKLFSSAGDGAVTGRTTPFPDIIRITPAPHPYPGLTPEPEVESRGENEEILSPLPVPPSGTDTYAKITPVIREHGLDLTDVAVTMAPTGTFKMYLINDKIICNSFIFLDLEEKKLSHTITGQNSMQPTSRKF